MAALPLAQVPAGTLATVTKLRANGGMLRRLLALGLHPDSLVTVVCTDRGHLIVSTAGARYAISRGMAMKILVTPAGEPAGAGA
ncbi:MAG: FeoA family protein [Methanoregulaceae archaeon]